MVSRMYEEAMKDGRMDPREHAAMLDALEGGRSIGALLDASDALSGALGRSGDPEYLLDMARVYASHVGKLGR